MGRTSSQFNMSTSQDPGFPRVKGQEGDDLNHFTHNEVRVTAEGGDYVTLLGRRLRPGSVEHFINGLV